jgi:copper chaperone NosL
MQNVAMTFHEYLDRPIAGWSRPVIALAAFLLLIPFFSPLWRVSMVAPQYPQGLRLDIYCYKLDAGHDGADLSEINILNHYIGMRPIHREDLADLDWLPFAFGILFLLALRVALIGNIRSLVDLSVLSTYMALVALGRFVYQLYTYGHDLSPDAPVDMEPFTPAIIGVKQVANFTTSSFPRGGGNAVGAFVLVIALLTLGLLWQGRRKARARLAAQGPGD